MKVDFYYDVVCPYAWIASNRIEAVVARHGATVRWRPVLLGGIFKHIEAPENPGAVMSAPKARLNLLDMQRQAAWHGVPLNMPQGHPRRSVEAMRLILSAPEDQRIALSKALFSTYWVEGRDIADPEVRAEVARAQGVDPEGERRPEVKQALFDATEAAVQAGAFGVPSMVFEGELFWGADRLPLLDAALAARSPAAPTLRFFHDFSSPFSYLGSTQVRQMALRQGARLELKPMLLGALFKTIGTPNVPMFAINATRRAWTAQDLMKWARWWGVPFRFPTNFPIRSVAPLRVALQEPETTEILYRAAWVHDRPIGEPEVLTAVLNEAGFDGEALVAGTQRPEIKALLKANTDEAEAIGACGAPTFEIIAADGSREIFWGQDRTPMVEAALRHHRNATPPGVADTPA